MNTLDALSGIMGVGLVGSIVALRFALAAKTEAPDVELPTLRDWRTAEAIVADAAICRYTEDDSVPFDQRDTMPCSAPATPRESELGREFGDAPAD